MINVFYKQITFRNGLPFPVEIPQKKLKERHGRKKSLMSTKLLLNSMKILESDENFTDH